MKKLTKEEMRLIRNNILGINSNTLSVVLEQESESFYMAMCLLLPKESFLREVDELGGLSIVVADYDSKEILANKFRVEKGLVDLRIRELYIEELHKQRQKINDLILDASDTDINLTELKESATKSLEEIRKEAERKLTNIHFIITKR